MPNLTLCSLLYAGFALQTVTLFGDAQADPVVRGIFGVERKLSDFREPTTQATVLVFLDPSCPVVQQYAQSLRALYDRYNQIPRDRAGRPVQEFPDGSARTYAYSGDKVCFLGIYPAPNLSLKAIAAHALDVGLPFRVLQDNRQQCMRKFGVSELAEVVVLNRDNLVVYRGTIDDQFYPGGSKPAPTEHYLRDVLDELLAGKRVEPTWRPPQGCRIPRLEEQPKPSKPITFHGNVQAILQAHCQRCHRQGDVGPMPLQTYEQVLAQADMIEEVVLDQRMPPWPGLSSRPIVDDLQLSAEQRSILLAWIRGGRVEGDRAQSPSPVDWPKPSEWQIGKPDLVLRMKKPHRVPATGVVDYVYCPIPAGFSEDRYIRAIEIVPGNKSVVHHIQVHEYNRPIRPGERDNLSAMEQLMLYGPTLDGAKLVGSFTPGNNFNARDYGTDAGMKLSRGANLIFELHYTTSGREAFDQSKIGIIFSREKPKREIHTHYFLRQRGDFVIPSNAQNHTIQQLFSFETPVRIRSVRPHMHLRGKSFRLELVDSALVQLADLHNRTAHRLPKGKVVLTIPIWDYNWQRTYEFETPLEIPRGKALLATGVWDNTRHNPRNPSWRVDAPWGQQTEHEMFNTLFLYEELDENAVVSQPR